MNKRTPYLGIITLAISLLVACGGGNSSNVGTSNGKNSGSAAVATGQNAKYPTSLTTSQMIDILASKTWVSQCYKNPDYPNPDDANNGPFQKDLISIRRTSDHSFEDRSMEMHYANSTCTGSPMYLDAGPTADGEPESLQIVGSPTKNNRGQWEIMVIDADKDEYFLVLTSPTSLESRWVNRDLSIEHKPFQASSENFAALLKQAKAQQRP